MKLKKHTFQKLKHNKIALRLLQDERYRAITKAVYSLVFNLFFALYHGFLGILSGSVLFIISALYYFLLSSMRFSAVLIERKHSANLNLPAVKFIGILLTVLSIVYIFVITVTMQQNAITAYGIIPMLTIATYTFIKITMAITTAIKHRKRDTDLVKAIHTIRYAEVAISLLTMQQSMLVSFGNATPQMVLLLNAFTGGGVCLFIFILGIVTIQNSRKE